MPEAISIIREQQVRKYSGGLHTCYLDFSDETCSTVFLGPLVQVPALDAILLYVASLAEDERFGWLPLCYIITLLAGNGGRHVG